MKNLSKSLAATFIITALLFQSCKKQDDILPTRTKAQEYQMATERQLLVNQTGVDMMNLVMSQVMSANTKGMRLSAVKRVANCADMVVDSSSLPYSFVIDLSGGCTDENGTPISGIITGTFSGGDLENPGDFIEWNTSGFNIDTFSISGTVRVEVASVSGNNTYGTFTSNLTTNFKYGQMELRGTNNFGLEYVHDPITNEGEMFFTGSGSGTTNGGLNFTQTITNPLMTFIGSSCNVAHFLQGKLFVQTSGLPDKEIDYGNGGCDSEAYITENGVQTRITLD